jgi:trehalose 6-phosphate phosphatase
VTALPQAVRNFLETEVSRRWSVLALDYDGTLAPFHVDRDRAVLPLRTRELIDALAQESRTRLVIVSGRPVDELVRIGAFPGGTELWGGHGWEHLDASGRLERIEVETGLASALADEFARLAGHVEPERLEHKHASIAVHWRGLEATAASTLEAGVREQWQQLAALHPLQVRGFDGGVELRITGRDKGSVMRTLLAHAGDSPLLYAGDDDTDEDAFRALVDHEHALSVRVAEEGYEGTTAATVTVDHETLLDLLDGWLEATRRAG